MLGFRNKSEMVDPADALRGRDGEMPVPGRHEVLGTPLKPPFPANGLTTPSHDPDRRTTHKA